MQRDVEEGREGSRSKETFLGRGTNKVHKNNSNPTQRKNVATLGVSGVD